ncbi:cupin domain-containing protein [Campylobacter sp. faydin G-105]|uniref:cupin domain-containing protein n=1 Tax=Campylobacter anatolicus TaxID=2829105 RepID=UPI001BA0A46C|nr:cupin domain-containing protein [Campylobacter anatolicus]MBR8461931.1 cupin domain-containing protein [Campylobacter anatolicus]
MSNYKIVSIPSEPRVELKNILSLSGCEATINELSANTSVPFVHTHKQNEELYIVLSGSGVLFIDGDEISLKQGDAIRIDPVGKRCFKALDSGMKYICIQAKKDSLELYTDSDGELVNDVKPSWL